MPEKGFSIDDLLNPKPRQYQDDFAENPKKSLRRKVSSGIIEARRVLNALELNSPPILLKPVCEYLGAYIVMVDVIEIQLGRF